MGFWFLVSYLFHGDGPSDCLTFCDKDRPVDVEECGNVVYQIHLRFCIKCFLKKFSLVDCKMIFFFWTVQDEIF